CALVVGSLDKIKLSDFSVQQITYPPVQYYPSMVLTNIVIASNGEAMVSGVAEFTFSSSSSSVDLNRVPATDSGGYLAKSQDGRYLLVAAGYSGGALSLYDTASNATIASTGASISRPAPQDGDVNSNTHLIAYNPVSQVNVYD